MTPKHAVKYWAHHRRAPPIVSEFYFPLRTISAYVTCFLMGSDLRITTLLTFSTKSCERAFVWFWMIKGEESTQASEISNNSIKKLRITWYGGSEKIQGIILKSLNKFNAMFWLVFRNRKFKKNSTGINCYENWKVFIRIFGNYMRYLWQSNSTA